MSAIILPYRAWRPTVAPGWGEVPSHPPRARSARWRRLRAGLAGLTRLQPGACCGCTPTPVGCTDCIPAVNLTFSAFATGIDCAVSGTLVYHPPVAFGSPSWSCGYGTLFCEACLGGFDVQLTCTGANVLAVSVSRDPHGGGCDCTTGVTNPGLVITSQTCGSGFLVTLDYKSSGLSTGCQCLKNSWGLTNMTISA